MGCVSVCVCVCVCVCMMGTCMTEGREKEGEGGRDGKRCQSNLSGKDEARCTHRCPLTQHLFASDVLAPANSAKKKKGHLPPASNYSSSNRLFRGDRGHRPPP